MSHDQACDLQGALIRLPALKWNHIYVIFPNLVFTPLFTSEQYILQLKARAHGFFWSVLAFKWLISIQMRKKANLLNMDTLHVNYFTVPLQSDSLHCFLLSCWCRSDHGGYYMLHRLPCRSTLRCKQVLCSFRSSFSGRQMSCTCTSSAEGG